MEFNISDPKNIVGLSSLMGDELGNSMLEIEKEIINGTNIQAEEDLETKNFKQEMERLTKTYDIDSYATEGDTGASTNLSSNTSMKYGTTEPSSYDFVPQSIEDNQLRYMTAEQQKQIRVDSVLDDMTGDRDEEFDMDDDKDEDDKTTLLEQIDMLRMTLEDDGIDVTNIAQVNKNSSIADIRHTYHRLKQRNDWAHSRSVAEEMIMAAVYGMEFLFDGEKEWFGRKPDLVGWSKTVQIKLRRCRYQTSSLVREIMREYCMTPGMQISLELILSMFLFSRQKKLVNQEEDGRYDEAFSNLNSL